MYRAVVIFRSHSCESPPVLRTSQQVLHLRGKSAGMAERGPGAQCGEQAPKVAERFIFGENEILAQISFLKPEQKIKRYTDPSLSP